MFQELGSCRTRKSNTWVPLNMTNRPWPILVLLAWWLEGWAIGVEIGGPPPGFPRACCMPSLSWLQCASSETWAYQTASRLSPEFDCTALVRHQLSCRFVPHNAQLSHGTTTRTTETAVETVRQLTESERSKLSWHHGCCKPTDPG